MIILYCLFFVFFHKVNGYYCTPGGCATGQCTCPSFLSKCDTTTDLNGYCTLTRIFLLIYIVFFINIIENGYYFVAAFSVLAVIVIILLVLLVCCCCCCKYKRGKEVKNVFVNTKGDFKEYDKL